MVRPEGYSLKDVEAYQTYIKGQPNPDGSYPDKPRRWDRLNAWDLNVSQ